MRFSSVAAIYSIQHVASGKRYVGSAVNLAKRIAQHHRALRAGTHSNVKLQRAWNKYGEGEFVFSVLEDVSDAATLIAREQHWIDEYKAAKAGYNVSPTAGSTTGYKHSEETKLRMSVAKLGVPKAPGYGAIISNVLKGRKMTDEQREKMRAAKLGKKRGPNPPEWNAKIAAALAGKRLSDEHRAALSRSASAREKRKAACATAD